MKKWCRRMKIEVEKKDNGDVVVRIHNPPIDRWILGRFWFIDV